MHLLRLATTAVLALGAFGSAPAAAAPLAWRTLDSPLAARADPACDWTWDGVDGDWSDGSKWGPAHTTTPTGGRACLPDGTYTVTVTANTYSLNGLTVGTGVTLKLTGALSEGGGAINRGTIQLMSSGRYLGSSLVNEGTLEDGEAPVAGSDTYVQAAIENSGTIRANASLQIRGAYGALVNKPSGTISTVSAGTLALLNFASVTVDGSVANAGTYYEAGALLKLGAVTATGKALQLGAGAVQAALDASGTGSASVDALGAVALSGDVGAGMTVVARNQDTTGANLLLDGDRTNHGAIVVDVDVANVDGTLGATGGAWRLTNLGTIDVKAGPGGNRYLKAALTNAASGLVTIEAGAVLTQSGAIDTTTAGTIDIAAGGAYSIVNGSAGTTFTQTGGTIHVAGAFIQGSGTHVHQAGTVTGGRIRIASQTQAIPSLDPSGPGGPTYETRSTVNLIGDVHADAKVIVVGSDIGQANLDLSADRTNNGIIELDQIENLANTSQISSSAGGKLTNKGTLHVMAGGNRGLNLVVLNQGSLTVDAYTEANPPGDDPVPELVNDGGTVDLNETIRTWGGYRQLSGNTRMNEGQIFVPFSPGRIEIQAGILSGIGSIAGPFDNAGEVQPGTPAKPYGRIHVVSSAWEHGVLNAASYNQAAGGVLSVGVNGVDAGTTYDQLEVDGPVNLAGTLEVAKGAYAPVLEPPDRFTIVKAASLEGSFSTATGLGTGPFELRYDAPPDAVVLQTTTPPTPPQIDIAGAEATEGDSGTKSLDFTVTLDKPADTEVHADWSTVDDSATSPSDFTASSGQVSFAAGQTEQTISVPVAGDTDIEGVESFLVRLRLPSGADLRVALATGRILPDDLGITSVRPVAVGDAGTSTLTVRGGGFLPGTAVRLERAGEPDRVATMIGDPVDGARLIARVDFTGAAHGAWDLVVQLPGGGASVTDPGAVTVTGATAPRVAVSVTVPAQLRYGWPGRATVSLRNEGSSDSVIDMLRIVGTDVKLRTEAANDFVDGPLDLMGADLAAMLDGTDVIPPGETRNVVVRFKSTTLAPHVPIGLDAELYPAGHIDAVVNGIQADPPPGRISGHVRDATGAGVPGVRVSAASATGPSAFADTGPDGAYVLDHVDDGTFLVGLGDEPTSASERHEVVVSAADPHRTVDFSAPISALGGTLRSAAADRLANARVFLLRDGAVVARTVTDGSGGFRFTVMGAGTFSLVAIHRTGGMARLADVAVEAGVPRTGLELTTGDRKLDVTVSGPGGPVTGATVFVEPVGFPGARWRQSTGPGGVVRFDGLPAGELSVDAGTQTLAPDAAQVSPGPGITPLQLDLTTGQSLSGTITASGSPRQDATAIAVQRTTGFQRRASSDASGHYALAGLPAGTYDLWFVAPGLAPQLHGDVALPGAAAVDAALTSAGTTVPLAIAGVDGGHVVGALFTARDKATGASLLSSYSDEDGVARLGPLPDGHYTVDVTVPGAVPVSHDLDVPAARGRRDFDPDTYVYPYTPLVAQGYKPNLEILNRPARVDWISQIPEPQKILKHLNGWQLENTKTSYEQPCPKANRLSAMITQRGVALEAAFDAWHLSWESLHQLNSSDVNKYLAKSTELGIKLWFLGKSLENIHLNGLDAPPEIGDVGDIEAGLAFAGEGYLASYMQSRASGEPLSPVDVAEKGQEALEILRHADTAYNGNVTKALGPLVDIANAARDIKKLWDEVKELPNDVRNRGDMYLKAQWKYSDVIAQIDDLLVQFRAAVALCPTNDDDGKPGPGATGGGRSDNAAPGDPNDMLGPKGVGDQAWIPGEQDLGYQIRFENIGPGTEHNPDNLPLANAPAVQVSVTEVLDDDVDLDAVELGDVGWGDVLVAVPGGHQSYHADVPQADGDTVRVDGALDRATRTIAWTLTTIDPTTGDIQSSPTRGFLPPEDGTGNGQGFVSYDARGKPGLAHGTKISAKATIVFDVNPPIDTPTHENTVDADPPVSAVSAVTQPGIGGPACQDGLAVAWSGTDAGSGLDGFDIWVSADGGAFAPWLTGTTATSGTYAGTPGHTYAFYSVARDLVGLDEAPPPAGEAQAVQTVCDRTAPVTVASVSGPDAVDGWRPGPVDVHLDAVDDAGGLGVSQLTWSASGAAPGGATVDSGSVTIPIAADGVTDLAFAATDAASNAAAGGTLEVKVDSKGPVVSVTTPAQDAHYALGRPVPADYTCSDPSSGLASCAGTVTSGLNVDTATAGERSFTVTGVDKVGHQTVVTRRYVVDAPAAPTPTPSPGAAPTATPTPAPAPVTQTPSFGARPVTITLSKPTSSKSARFSVRSNVAFALTGRAQLLRGKKPASKARSFALARGAKATVVIALDRATRRALKAGRPVKVSLVLELRAGAARKTVKQAFKLRVR